VSSKPQRKNWAKNCCAHLGRLVGQKYLYRWTRSNGCAQLSTEQNSEATSSPNPSPHFSFTYRVTAESTPKRRSGESRATVMAPPVRPLASERHSPKGERTAVEPSCGGTLSQIPEVSTERRWVAARRRPRDPLPDSTTSNPVTAVPYYDSRATKRVVGADERLHGKDSGPRSSS
jgi:hypothetical protein